jgi:alkylhydroperoxidase family enzyme
VKTPRIDVPPGGYLPGFTACLYDVHAAAMRASTIDPLTKELVRLRCARYHDCRVCQSLRLASGQEAGVDEIVAAKVDRYEESDLGERQKAALRFADAYMTDPGGIDADLRAQLLEHFTRDEIVQLTLDVVAWTLQKALVCLLLDVPVAEDHLTLMEFDEEGHVLIGAPLS